MKKKVIQGPFGRLRLKGGESESFWSVAAGEVGPVFVNGHFMGRVDELNDVGGGLLLNPGTCELKVISQIHGEFMKAVTIEAGKVSAVVYGTAKER